MDTAACLIPACLCLHCSCTSCFILAERDAQSEVVVQLESLLSTQGFLKKMLAFKSEHVRTAAYTLVAHICYRYTLGLIGVALAAFRQVSSFCNCTVNYESTITGGDKLNCKLWLSA